MRSGAGRCIYLFLILYHIFLMLSNRSAPTLREKGLVSGETSPYNRPLELGKKSHMVGPVGNTELGGRWRRVHHLQVAYEFRENLRPYRAARNGRKIAYGALRSEIRARTAVHGPLNTAQKRKEGRLPASLVKHYALYP